MSTRRADVFHAVADANRRAILDLLMTKERPVNEIAARFDISFQGVSQHLRMLANAGLVEHRRAGRHRYYRMNAEALKEIDDWVGRYRRFWQRGLERLEEHLAEKD